MIRLPIDPHIPKALELLEKSASLVVQASPGSGKTTRLPPALLKAPFRKGDAEILVLEPRRLAAKLSARRVAQELQTEVGKLVGYQFRFENVTSAATRLRFLTEGMLMRRLLGDPRLANVAAVVLDEFHERHLHGDIALAFLRDLQQRERPDLKLVVMSATLDTESVSAYLGGAPVLSVEAPRFPIDIQHLREAPSRRLEQTVRDAVERMLPDQEGDTLVFLPGMADIRRAEEAFQPLARTRNLLVLPLHGELTREEQDLALKPGDRTKIILSTNVAETSLTIEGVNTVIDSGLHRIASYSWWSGVPALRTRAISRASAIQRAGRAGRTGPGRCLRLYTKGDFDGRPAFEVPEIQRADLAQTLLELKAIGVADLERFPWFEKPAAQALESSRGLLHRIGALDGPAANAGLTELGRKLAEIPAHPRLARMLVEAQRQGVLDEAATLTYLISEGELDSLDALEQTERLRRSAAKDMRMNRVHQQLTGAVKGIAPGTRMNGDARQRLAFSVLTGFPDRVTQKRAPADPMQKEVELLFSGGGSASVENTGVASEHELFVTLDIQERQHLGQLRSKLAVRSLCAIEPEWLFDLEPTALSDRDELIWDADRKRVASVSRMSYDALVLSEGARKDPGEELAGEASAMLLKTALGLQAARLPEIRLAELAEALGRVTDSKGREEFENTVARVLFLRQHQPSLGLPDLSGGAELARALQAMLHGKLSLKEIEAMDWSAELLQSLPPEQYQALERLAPSHVQLPRGRRVRVNYPIGQAPWIESRLQDFFGMKQGPSLLGGRIALTLHLLAPNQRAVQVTSDLAGFWERNYPQLRRELGRRYPRHAWPEDPLA